MPKLSKEAWTVAFFEVMKEPLPTTPGTMRRVGEKLAGDKAGAAVARKDASDKAKLAEAVADDAERKRYGAGVTLDERLSTTLTEEGRRSAQQDYDAAAARAREAADEAHAARLALKQADFNLKTVEAQLAEFATVARQAVGGGAKPVMSPELEQGIRTAQLEKRFEGIQQELADLDERKRLREDDLAAARRNLSMGEAHILEGDVASFKERIATTQARADAVQALLPGYALAEAAAGNKDKLAEASVALKGAAKASDDALAAEQAKVAISEAGQKAKAGELEAAAGRDPALKAAFDLLTAKRSALGELEGYITADRDGLAELQRKFKESADTLDAHASGSGPALAGQQLTDTIVMYSTRAKTLARDKGALLKRQDELRATQQATEAARGALAEAVAARLKQAPANPELAAAQAALALADDALARANAAGKEAKDASVRVHELADEAERRLKHAQALPAATATAAEFNTALKGVEDTPIWDGSSALQKKLGPQRFEQLRVLANKLAAEYETLVKNGATMEELQALYKDTPEVWKPPRFREEEKNWVAMKVIVDAETDDKYAKETKARLKAVNEKVESFKKTLKNGETVASVVSAGLANADKLSILGIEALTELGKKLGKGGPLAADVDNVLSLAAGLATMAQAPMATLIAGQDSMEKEDPVEALMAQDDFMSALGDLVGGLTGGFSAADKLAIGGVLVEEVAKLLPGIGVATNAAAAMKALADTAARFQESMDDADAHAEALEGGHRAETAIDQFARRDKELAKRAATDTGIAIVKTAAAGVDLTGVGVLAGSVMKGAATGVGLAKTVGMQIVDRQEGEQAKALLDRAQAGDGHARSELFRYHPRYAKGILAIMASEGDSLALKVLSTHGLNEDMIRRSSPKIIKRYLMKKFGEDDEPASWSSLKAGFDSIVSTVSGLLGRADDFFGNVADKLLTRFDANDLVAAQAKLSDLAYQLSSQTDVAKAAAAVSELRLRRTSLATTATPEQADDLAAVDKALDAELVKVAGVRDRIVTSLGQLNAALEKIAAQPASNPLRAKAEAAGKVVMREHLTRIERLAAVG